MTCHLAFSLIRALCLPLLVLLSVYALLFPYSETSGGGNHNLHFLGPTSRRGLYPLEPVTLRSLGLSKHGKHIPKHALVPYLPLSLYIPNAGFLWAAELDELDVADQVETQTDVFFSDPFGMRYPWALEEPDPPGEQLDDDQLEFVQSHVWPGALVYLRSRIDHRYLGTAEDQNSTSSYERLDYDEQDGLFQRFWVGMHAKPSAPSVWILDHDPDKDAGFSLYNPHQECYLATTFRTYGLTTNNGTAENHMCRAYEASCTRVVSKSASTIWVIEGASSCHRDGNILVSAILTRDNR
ncbi:hypothetical protein EDB81DRAFT_882514 [Dactylonectria macrodidyma]|uniref:Uncharacterized protein n=1 Tax=Dactylonectria macrodidyma TaxID=307937 RepID=A0A9P9F5P4_9HYPO|nr:hypothetical protein EDB81DRAFT_882514 [Dactylonectria macrodidyma]